MVLIGYWEESMNTLALVIISVPMAIIIGFGLGIWGFYSKRAEKIIMPILDIFQTVPTFAYLLPILLLFGFGTAVGLIASILYSFPPMVRNTILGLKRVPDHIIESAIMSGANSKQLFWHAMLPSCKKQILLGINQSTMAALSMVIIAAIIGGTATFKGKPVMLIGHEKGKDTKDKIERNFGMSQPEGYRKAARLMKLAEDFSMPVITFIDTPGAYPGIESEERGNSQAIAYNLSIMSKLKTPIIVINVRSLF